jgi:phospholipid-binding lipoprotein MlaA
MDFAKIKLAFIMIKKCLLILCLVFSDLSAQANNINYDEEENHPIIADPLEPLNRAIYGVNKNIDFLVIKPVSHIYITIMPQWGQQRVSSALNNFYEPVNAINNLFQHHPKGFMTSLGRFVINSTVGILGLFDVASQIDLKEQKSNFADTLRHYCIGSGSYIIIPLIGPASNRAATGRLIDFVTNPLNFVLPNEVLYSKLGVEIAHNRGQLISATNTISSVALDEYAFVRSVYSQKYYEVINGSHSHCKDQDKNIDKKK